MTTQLITNNLPVGSSTELDKVGVAQAPTGLPDLTTITQLANEFFSALPGLGNGQTSGLNLDIPNIAPPPHSPQPAENVTALSGRAPNIAFQKGLNPELPDHIPNLPDYPERRAIASAPIIGGANIPKPPFEPHAPRVAHPQPSIPVVAAKQPEASTDSPFYFLNDHTRTTSQQDYAISHHEADIAQSFHLPYGDDLTHLLKNDPSQTSAAKPQQSASGFYFLDDFHSNPPQAGNIPAHYHADKTQFTPSHQQPLDVFAIRKDFPILQERVNGRPLVWFDNAATTQKPQSVIDRIAYFYQHENSNIHRAAHELAARATDAYEHARNVVARFIGARSAKEIIFVRGTTEGINLIAKTWGEQNIGEGDEIIVSNLEHHANIVPWYQLAQKVGAKLRVIPVDDTGQIILEELPKLINERTKLVSVTQVSNALGTVTPIPEIINIAHARGVRVLVDAAQSVSHIPTNVQSIDADFLVFSGHKVFGPTGIGAVYAKPEILDNMPVWEGGGNMIQDVTFEHVIYQPAPNKFEAGTGNIADAVGLGAALEYVERIGIQNIATYEHALLEYGQNALASVSGLRLIGTALNKASVMSFTLEGYSTEQVGKALNEHGIAVRSGHHCAQPILRRFGVEQTVRPSLAFYNTTEEIDLLVAVLHQLRRKKHV
ncbi:cysteine desulfurase [Acinetobacter qingfengensis]|uniref:cysteine desulfurase n=1 Tax=Acinetobacter qingfengensis TaxID=1262585 RepID=A0A1E7R1V4_9GAMM|nr:family 2A encapsulin nanocompartment cargo protein cysteine desulfurase [Acinetobacter qingfengensis]KAA8735392.1 cysteine desulfurase [Acinetobacter qingfengensis]OEY93297.1 cysteine desulfurase [Acinetobacter qingfengensis]